MIRTTPEQNKALVLEAFDTLFNKRDYDAASRFCPTNTRSTAPTSSRAAKVSSTSSRPLPRPSNMSRPDHGEATLSSSTGDSLALDSQETGSPPDIVRMPMGCGRTLGRSPG